MFGRTKTVMSSTPMDSSNVSALMCGQVSWTVVWLGLTFFHPAYMVRRIFLQKVLGELLENVTLDIVDDSVFNTMTHYPILQVPFVIILTNVSSRNE